MASERVYIDIYIGHRDVHTKERAEYNATMALLAKNAVIYGLPPKPEELSGEQQQILSEIDVLEQPI